MLPMINESTFHYLAVACFLGLSAGISPGPLLTLVLTQTLKHNKSEGIKVALSPLVTDLPIVVLTLFVFSQLAQFNSILGIISFAGGLFVAYLGYESWQAKGLDINASGPPSQSLQKGIVANFLSPHPYLFWATVGMPYAFKAYQISLLSSVLFFVCFYAFLVGSKITVAVLVSHTKKFINQKIYRIIMRILGSILLLFSVLFFRDGIRYLQLL